MNTMLSAFIVPYLEAYDDDFHSVSYDFHCDELETIVRTVNHHDIDTGFVTRSLRCFTILLPYVFLLV